MLPHRERERVEPGRFVDEHLGNTHDRLGAGMSDGAKKKGFRKSDSGNIQKYQCRSCSKYFSTNLGFENMHASPDTVTAAMDLYFSGMSYRAIRRRLGLHGVDVSHVTVYNWVAKYVKVMDGYLKGHQPQVGDKWHADEMWIKVRKDRKHLFMMMRHDPQLRIGSSMPIILQTCAPKHATFV